MTDSVDYIITAKHYCQREGAGSVLERIKKLQGEIKRKKKISINFIYEVKGRPINARIELGQWIATCECGGAEFVDPDEPIFACMSCGNRVDAGYLRPVVFPPTDTRVEIERLVLERPVDDLRGLDDAERAHMAKATIFIEQEDGRLFPLTRTWNPSESVDDLKAENAPVYRIRKEGGE